jgi:aspartyl-tRNA(Asn)/glutamyl-tRNA(Gln) amidotransferase subunit A
MTRETVPSLAAALADGRTTSVALTEAALDLIESEGGDGNRAFVGVDREGAIAQAQASDLLRAWGIVPSPLAGIPISVKDLLDVRGQVTRAGSVALRDAPPAERDATVVARLRAAGAVVIGRTNMTEFAYSGLGLNPHHGTPANPAAPGRIPGGSSSGAGASVARGVTPVAIGSDTGGSLRIPAAFCGVVGFKPTQARVPRDGAYPLSWTLDSIGPIGRSVACCALADAAMAGDPVAAPRPVPVRGLRLGVPRSYLLDGLEDEVARRFEAALGALSRAGAQVQELALGALDRIPALGRLGAIAAAEAHAWHRDLMARAGEAYDPRVRSRILLGAKMSAADYIDLIRGREALMAETDASTREVDALVLPTVAMAPPPIEAFEDDAEYARLNALALRNTSAFNFLERPAISLPCGGAGSLGGPPVGLMVVGRRGHDRRLLQVAAALEPVVG